jgi:hypothetical protein
MAMCPVVVNIAANDAQLTQLHAHSPCTAPAAAGNATRAHTVSKQSWGSVKLPPSMSSHTWSHGYQTTCQFRLVHCSHNRAQLYDAMQTGCARLY